MGGKAQAMQQAASSMPLEAHRSSKGLLGPSRSSQKPLSCEPALFRARLWLELGGAKCLRPRSGAGKRFLGALIFLLLDGT